MKIHFEHKSTAFTLESTPMEPERFNALCKLAVAAVGAGVSLGAVALIGFWAIPWSVGALTLVGVYKLIKESF